MPQKNRLSVGKNEHFITSSAQKVELPRLGERMSQQEIKNYHLASHKNAWSVQLTLVAIVHG